MRSIGPLADARGTVTRGMGDGLGTVATRTFPLAYLITFSCYGKRLHGEGAETVDRRTNAYGTPFVPPSAVMVEIEEQQMTNSEFALNADQREIVLRAIQEVCAYRAWRLWAVHVRSDHVHVVVSASIGP
ncbi:MAG: hypothetical protein EXQ56_13985 [Acidobacteria bacterium]|nr:hypothetical protein [Acidobacteriota bacterium]